MPVHLPASGAVYFGIGSEDIAEAIAGKLHLLHKLDLAAQERLGKSDQLESAIANYELAFRMQAAVPASAERITVG